MSFVAELTRKLDRRAKDRRERHQLNIQRIYRESMIPDELIEKIYAPCTPKEYFIADYQCTCNIAEASPDCFLNNNNRACIVDAFLLYLRSRHAAQTYVDHWLGNATINQQHWGTYSQANGFVSLRHTNRTFSQDWYADRENNSIPGVMYRLLTIKSTEFRTLFLFVGSWSDTIIDDRTLKICPFITTNRLDNHCMNFELLATKQFVEFCQRHVTINVNYTQKIKDVEEEIKRESKF
jgi:hypothetical protein